METGFPDSKNGGAGRGRKNGSPSPSSSSSSTPTGGNLGKSHQYHNKNGGNPKGGVHYNKKKDIMAKDVSSSSSTISRRGCQTRRITGYSGSEEMQANLIKFLSPRLETAVEPSVAELTDLLGPNLRFSGHEAEQEVPEDCLIPDAPIPFSLKRLSKPSCASTDKEEKPQLPSSSSTVEASNDPSPLDHDQNNNELGKTEGSLSAIETLPERISRYHREQEEAYIKRRAELEKQQESRDAPKMPPVPEIPSAILEQRMRLPIYVYKEQLIELVTNNQFVIVIGETGSGKSTQVAQFLMEADLHGNGRIGVTQSRRVAAKSLAERVAQERGVEVGSTVGYSIRFESKVSDETVIKFLTDGLLVKECVMEHNLHSYNIIIVDEAHERRMNTDVCFGILKRAARIRPDLKVIICSATLEKDKYQKYFNGAPVLEIEGTSFPVQKKYIPKNLRDYLPETKNLIMTIAKGRRNGDILVFLPGQEEIEQLSNMLDAEENKFVIFPCCAAVSIEEQEKMFMKTPKGKRKVVLATNIAETSVTIDGIVFVIDSGYYKIMEYCNTTSFRSLNTKRITRFQAIQRAGRAGRTRPGVCYRLYSEKEFTDTMINTELPEIMRSNVDAVVLDIISLGISDPRDFDFMDAPDVTRLLEAMIRLKELGALDEKVQLTDLGRKMSEFPLDPQESRTLLESIKLGCEEEVLMIVSLLSTQVKHLFAAPTKDKRKQAEFRSRFSHSEGDLLTLWKIYREWVASGQDSIWCIKNGLQHRILEEAEEIRKQLKDMLCYRETPLEAPLNPGEIDCEKIRKAFTSGFFHHVARRQDSTNDYEVLGSLGWVDQTVSVQRKSSLYKESPNWIIYNELMTTVREPILREVIKVDPGWIGEYAPDFVARMANYGVYFR